MKDQQLSDRIFDFKKLFTNICQKLVQAAKNC